MAKLFALLVVGAIIVAVVITMKNTQKNAPAPSPGGFGPVVVTVQMPNPLAGQ